MSLMRNNSCFETKSTHNNNDFNLSCEYIQAHETPNLSSGWMEKKVRGTKNENEEKSRCIVCGDYGEINSVSEMNSL